MAELHRQIRVRYQRVPDDCLKCLDQRGFEIWWGIHNDCGVGQLGERAVRRAHDAVDQGTPITGELNRVDEVDRDVVQTRAATDTEHQYAVGRRQIRYCEPRGKRGVPSVFVGARGQLGNVVRGSVALDPTQFPEVIDGV